MYAPGVCWVRRNQGESAGEAGQQDEPTKASVLVFTSRRYCTGLLLASFIASLADLFFIHSHTNGQHMMYTVQCTTRPRNRNIALNSTLQLHPDRILISPYISTAPEIQNCTSLCCLSALEPAPAVPSAVTGIFSRILPYAPLHTYTVSILVAYKTANA
jgi:hypothetical protein